MTRPQVWTTDAAVISEERRSEITAYVRPPSERLLANMSVGPAPAVYRSCDVRISRPEDLAFVVDCWTKNDPALRGRRISESTAHVRALLARAESRLIIAHVPDESDAILGWAATEDGGTSPRTPACIHYLYVRRDARRQGIARLMVGSTLPRLEYSHAPPKGFVVPSGWVLNTERARTR